jgi:AcrR family transcriptional regulator
MLNKMILSNRQYEIIETAGKLLTEKGISGLTIKNIANEIGFSEGAIYRHFKSKEDILVGMLQYLQENMETRFSNIDTTLPALVQLKEIFLSQLNFFKDNTQFVVAVFSDGLMDESDNINSHISNIMAVKLKYLSPVIKQLQDEKIITNKISTDDLLHIIMGTFRLMMFKWKNGHFKGDIVKKGNHIINSLLIVLKL